jgi:hypothetical protein
MPDPLTTLHYAPNANFIGDNVYAPGAAGFNLADVTNLDQIDTLPAGVQALVFLEMTNGVDAAFQDAVRQYIGNSRVYGFYLSDMPDPSLVSADNLKAESDWIHANVPGVKTFIVEYDGGTPAQPIYSFTPANTGIDLYGIAPYPIQTQFSGGTDFSIIGDAVKTALADGIPLDQIVPVYQAFGGGGYPTYVLPTAAQEQQILSTWGSLVPSPAFDYAYSWGSQLGDTALVDDSALRPVLAAHNAPVGPVVTPAPVPPPAIHPPPVIAPPGPPPPVPPARPTLSDATLNFIDHAGGAAKTSVIMSGTLATSGSMTGTVLQSTSGGTDTVTFANITSATLRFGTSDVTMNFVNPEVLTVTGGSGIDTVVAGSGKNQFTAGSGTLDVTGGPGRDTYVFRAGGGLLRIEDFNLGQHDSLTVDRSLLTSMRIESDGHGGTMLTIGQAGHGVDLVGIPSFSSANIHFV